MDIVELRLLGLLILLGALAAVSAPFVGLGWLAARRARRRAELARLVREAMPAGGCAPAGVLVRTSLLVRRAVVAPFQIEAGPPLGARA
jgi:hypothetical protein